TQRVAQQEAYPTDYRERHPITLKERERTVEIFLGRTRGGLTESQRAEVLSIFAASGVPRNAVYVRTYKPSSSTLASIKINYSKIVAEAGPCGRWPHDIGPSLDAADTENRPYWNLGCANQRNLAAMVDNPADLVQPRGETP